MRPFVLKKQLAAASATAVCAAQTPVSGTPLAINGSASSGGVATLDTQRQILLTYGDEAAARTLVITGTDDTGFAISETLNVPSGAAGTVATEQSFLTVKSALPGGGGWTAAVTLGTNAVGSTPWYLLNPHLTPFALTAELEFTGAATASFDTTTDSPMPPIPVYAVPTRPIPVATPLPSSAGVSVNTQVAVSSPVLACRLTVLSGTGAVAASAVQAGIRN